MMEKDMAFSAVVKGRVQGVGFRYFCQREARKRGLSGWVRNADNGSVELWSEGGEEAQEGFLKWLKKGPPNARVDAVYSKPETPKNSYADFSIER